MGKQRLLSILALCASFFSFGVIALGAFTRLINAGLGCPDWPGCYGQLTVPMTEAAQLLANIHYPETHLEIYKAWAEMIHRYFVGGLSLFIMSIIGIIFVRKECRFMSNIVLALGLVLLLAYQIILGKWTVTLKLLPVIVTQHLLGGFLILCALWLVYLNNRSSQKIAPCQFPKTLLMIAAIIGLVMIFLQISLGAWTSTNYASLSCPDFPLCMNSQSLVMHFKEAFNFSAPIGINYEGGVLSEVTRQTIQMTHRFGALILTVYLFLFMAYAMPRLKHAIELTKSLYLIMGLLTIQLCIGMANIIFKLPLITAIGHNLVAVLLLVSMITFIFKLAHTERKVSG